MKSELFRSLTRYLGSFPKVLFLKPLEVFYDKSLTFPLFIEEQILTENVCSHMVFIAHLDQYLYVFRPDTVFCLMKISNCLCEVPHFFIFNM